MTQKGQNSPLTHYSSLVYGISLFTHRSLSNDSYFVPVPRLLVHHRPQCMLDCTTQDSTHSRTVVDALSIVGHHRGSLLRHSMLHTDVHQHLKQGRVLEQFTWHGPVMYEYAMHAQEVHHTWSSSRGLSPYHHTMTKEQV